MTLVENSLCIKWRCPSNIALVKYWGKKDQQIPCNASLSITLSKSFSEVELLLQPKDTSSNELSLLYYFEQERNTSFENKVKKYIEDNRSSFPFVEEYNLIMHSHNSFPHSTGIASSAAAFCAIALTLLDAQLQLSGREVPMDEFNRKASNLARLGSGSAARSVFPNYSVWGKVDELKDSSDEYATEVVNVHENFLHMKDAILIVDNQPKKVSSTIGHNLMNGHAYASTRFKQANERVSELLMVLKQGNYEHFIRIVESEALTLHAMMMTSNDYYLLMKPNTLVAIEKLWQFREETKIPVCFTLDAGPNLHVLYPSTYEEQVEEFLQNNFKDCTISIIFDESGRGPQKILD